MVRVLVKSGLVFASLLLFCGPSQSFPQDPVPASLNTSGSIVIDGHPTPYLIRRLPISSFPDLPPAVQDHSITAAASSRNPMKRGSRKMSSPPALTPRLFRLGRPLLSAGNRLLLVFFGGRSSQPFTLASSPETDASNRTDHRKFSASIGQSNPHCLRTFTSATRHAPSAAAPRPRRPRRHAR